MSDIQALQSIVAADHMPMLDRRNAASYLVRLELDATPEPSDDDPEIVELMTPWKDAELAAMWEQTTNGRSVRGWSLSDARKQVRETFRERTLLRIVVDESRHRLERLAAVDGIIATMHPDGFHRRNSYTAERLLDSISPGTAYRWTHVGMQQVARPPRDFADLWP